MHTISTQDPTNILTEKNFTEENMKIKCNLKKYNKFPQQKRGINGEREREKTRVRRRVGLKVHNESGGKKRENDEPVQR